MSWKELALKLAKDKGHDMHCPFRGCLCRAVDRQYESIAEIVRKEREESKTS